MAISFPGSKSNGQKFTAGNKSWTWNGSSWKGSTTTGGDATTFDSLDSSQFLRSDTSDTATGSYSFSHSYNEFGNSTGSVSNDGSWNARLNLAGSSHARLDVKSVSDGIITSMYSHSGHNAGKIGTYSNHQLKFIINGSDKATLSTAGSLSTTSQGTLWGASNDGSGSGLDADTVDGIQASGFATSSHDHTILKTSGNYQWTESVTAGNYPTVNGSPGVQTSFVRSANGWPDYGAVLHVGARGGTDAGGDFQLFCGHGSANGGNYLRVRNADNSASPSDSWTSWRTIWDSGNDGSGSGLDADTVDGLQASSFLRSDASDSFVGDLNVNNMIFKSNTNTQRNLKLQPVSTSTDVGISLFNGPGTWVMQLYGNTGNGGEYGFLDGNWAGWDIRKVRNGRLYLNGNNSYYIDPEGTSKFNVITATGDITANSDISLKDNITPIPNALDKVLQIRGVTYNRNDIEDNPKHVGVIAQEVEKVLPEVVSQGEDGIKSVAYGNMVGLLIEAIKEQQEQIDMLKEKLESK